MNEVDLFLASDALHARVVRWCRAKRIDWWLKLAPAMLVGAGWLVLVVVWFAQAPPRLRTRYVRAADAALAGRDYAAARVASERLLKLDGEHRDDHVLRLAKSMAGQGKEDLALIMITQLISTQTRPHSASSLFLADTILKHSPVNPLLLRIAERHLKRVLAAEPDSAEAHALLGEYHGRTGDWRKAREEFLRARTQRPETALWLCSAAIELGEPGEARRWAEVAAKYYEAQARQAPEQVEWRLRWAEAEWRRGESSRALGVLEQSMARKKDPAYSQLAATILADQARQVGRAFPENIGERWRYIREGLGYDPLSEALLGELISLAREPNPEARAAESHLKALASQGGYHATINFQRGMDAWRRNDFSNARLLLQDAYSVDPKNPVIANNLAFLLASTEPPELERGLKLINDVLDRYPRSPVFRETRGQLLLRNGQWAEAAKDLEIAAQHFTNSPALQTSLAEAYRRAGRADLSAQHQRVAEALRQNAPRR